MGPSKPQTPPSFQSLLRELGDPGNLARIFQASMAAVPRLSAFSPNNLSCGCTLMNSSERSHGIFLGCNGRVVGMNRGIG